MTRTLYGHNASADAFCRLTTPAGLTGASSPSLLPSQNPSRSPFSPPTLALASSSPSCHPALARRIAGMMRAARCSTSKR